MIDSTAFAKNLIVVVLLGCLLGGIAIANREWLNRFFDHMIELEQAKLGANSSFQFSLSGMLVTTSVAAIVAASLRWAWGASEELLLGVYLLGPTALILLAMIPRKISWQARVVLLAPSTLLLIGYALYVGGRLGLPSDHVMMGVFICWVPQTVIAAGCLTVGLAIRYNMKSTPKTSQTS